MVAIIFFSITIFCLFLIFAGVGSTSSKQPPHKETQNSKHDPLYVERMEEAKHQAEERGDLEAIKAIEEDRYDQLMQKRAEKNSLYIKTQNKASFVPRKSVNASFIHEYDIAGINFRRGISNYVGNFTGYLKPQPTNRHDPNAIAIYHQDGHHLGYIPAYETEGVRALQLDFPIPISGNIEEAYDDDEDRHFFVGVVWIRK